MHEKFGGADRNHLDARSQTVKDYLKGPRDFGFEATSGFILGNPAVIAVGEHQLMHSSLHSTDDGKVVQQDNVVASEPFVTVFGTALFPREGVYCFVEGLLSEGLSQERNTQLEWLHKLTPAEIGTVNMSLLGVTFSTVDEDEPQDSATEMSTLVPATKDTQKPHSHFSAYGYASLSMMPGPAGDVDRTIRFFGGIQDLVSEDKLPIDVNLSREDGPAPTQLEDFSRVTGEGQERVIFGRSEPKPFVDKLQIVNQILDTRLATDFSPELILDVMRTVLR
jgi:hypothetical protein